MTAERRRYLLRATEDMVTAHRIEAITREHASIANMLDQREIFELDEIQIKQGKFVKIEADSRIQSRRGARAETEIKPVATQAVESFKEKGINVQLLSGGYDMELRVWKEKSSKPAYAEQRKFQYPELEDFLHKMNKEQKMEYKQKVGAAIIKLADKFREECKQLKADMDLNGIFHTEANAHRAHCIYLTMLHKHFSAKTIENPVLKEMYREEQKRRREEAARDEEKAQLLREMEERDRNAEKTRHRMMRRSMEMPHGSSLLGSPSTHATSAADTASRGQVSHDGDASTHASSKKKSKSGPNAKAPPGKGPVKGTDAKSSSMRSSSSSSLPAIQGALKVKTNSAAELPSASSVVSSPQARKEKVQLEPPEKAFKRKLRQTVADGQVTNVFTQETQNNLLSGEVARLQQAEVVQFKRPKDRSDAWSESMSQWMLQDLQTKQVSRIAAGTVSNVGASLGSPVRQTSFSASSPTFAAADTNASGAVYSINLGGENMTLQQQVTMDALALQRQLEQKEQWKAFGKAAVLAVDQFLTEHDDSQRSGSPFHEQQHHSPTGGMRGVYSPSRFVPFDEFYDILKKTSEPLLDSALTVDDNVILPASLAATMQSATGVALSSAQLPPSSSSSPSHALKRAASMNAATMSHSVNPPPPLTSSLSVQHLPRMGSSSFLLDPQTAAAAASSSSSTASPTNAAGATTASNAVANNNNSNSNNLNIVDVMRQTMEPRNFAAYEKVQDLTLPSAKLLARLNGTGGGASHRRLTSHLGAVGQTAIELRDSFGRLGRDANKGFDNMFSSQRMQEKGLLAHRDHRREDEANAVTFTNSTDGSGRSGASIGGGRGTGGGMDDDDPFMDHDDVVRRLERTGEVGERTRNGRMRATDMDAMLDKVTRTGATNNSNKKTATISVTDTNATTSNGRTAAETRPSSRSSNAATPRRRHRAGVSRGSPSSPNSPHRALTPQNGSTMASPGGFGRNSPSSMGGPRATSLDDDDDDDGAYGDRDEANDGRVLHVPDDDLDLQHKLVATWDTLGVTANDRLAFMLKYSADVYAAEMSRSVDIWAGVAVCHVLLQRLMAVRDKAAQGLLLVPLSAKQIWRHVVRPLPALIRLNHEALIPPSLVFAHHHDDEDSDSQRPDDPNGHHQHHQHRHKHHDDDDEDNEFSEAAIARRRSRPLNKPYSVYLLARIQHMLGAIFAKHTNIPTRDAVWHPQVLTDAADAIDVNALSSFQLQQWHVDDLVVAQRLIRDLLRQAVRMQQRLLLRCRAEFDDEIPCGHNRYCRDFLQNVVNQLDRDEAAAAGTL